MDLVISGEEKETAVFLVLGCGYPTPPDTVPLVTAELVGET